jgi:hypothetical protein
MQVVSRKIKSKIKISKLIAYRSIRIDKNSRLQFLTNNNK